MFNSSYYRLKPCSCQNYTILSSLYTQNTRDTKDDITWYRFSSAGGRDQKRQNWPKGMSASSEQFYLWSHWEKPENIASVWKVCCFQFSGLFPGSLSQILLAFQLWIACLIYHHLIISICLPPGIVDKALLWFSYTLHLLLGCFAQLAAGWQEDVLLWRFPKSSMPLVPHFQSGFVATPPTAAGLLAEHCLFYLYSTEHGKAVVRGSAVPSPAMMMMMSI